MKKLIIIVMSFIFFPCILNAQEKADEIVRNVDKILGPGPFVGEITMESFQSNGKIMRYEMKIYHKTKDSVLVEVLSPEIEKGRKILRIKNKVWMYMPSVKRTIQVSQKDEVLGSDFSNYDLTNLSLIDDYNSVIDSTSNTNYYLHLKAVSRSINYDMIRSTVRKKDNMPLTNEFYTSTNKKLKTLNFSDVKNYGRGILRPSVLTMINSLVQNKKTIVKYNTFKYNVPINDALFNRNTFADF